MILHFNWKRLLISLLIPLLVGGLSALITGSDMMVYKTVNQPPLAPPSWLFPVAWTILYILMGISLYLVWNSDAGYDDKRTAYILFGVQLFLNFIWSPVFFIGRQYLIAFAILVALWIFVLLMIISFFKISKIAEILQIPYLLWITFAGYLNFSIYLLNR